MKVAFTCDIFARQKAGGISVHFYRIILALINQNIEVCFVGTVNQFKLADNNIFFKKLYFLQRLLVPSHFLPVDLSCSGVDIIHHTYYTPTSLFFGRIPVFTTFHDALEIRFFWSRPLSSITIILSKVFCFVFSYSVACVGSFSLSEYIHTYGLIAKFFTSHKPFIVRNSSSIELGDLDPTDSASAIYNLIKTLDSYTILGYIGSRKPYKNFSYVCDSFHRLKSSYPSSRFFLLIVGGGNLSPAEATDLQNISHLCLPSPDTSTVAAFYKSIHILLHPSSYEGFAMPVLESAIFSCDVLASPCGALRDFGFQNIRFSNDISSGSFASALVKWFAQFSSRQREPSLIIDTSGYSWPSSAKCLLNAYRDSQQFS